MAVSSDCSAKRTENWESGHLQKIPCNKKEGINDRLTIVIGVIKHCLWLKLRVN